MSSTSGKDACHRAQVGHFDYTMTNALDVAGAPVGAATGVVAGTYYNTKLTVGSTGTLSSVTDGSAIGDASCLNGTNQTFTPGSGYVAVTTALQPTGGPNLVNMSYASGVFTLTKAGWYQVSFTLPLLKSAALSGGSGTVQIGIGLNGSPATAQHVRVYDSQLSTTDDLPVTFSMLVLSVVPNQNVAVYVNNAYAVSDVIVIGGQHGRFAALLVRPI